MSVNLVINNYGTFLGKTSERLVVKENGKVVQEVPFFDLAQITITTSGASLSSDVIRMCMEHGVQINFLSSKRRFFKNQLATADSHRPDQAGATDGLS